MPSLTLLNGPPGVGKSTIAQLYLGQVSFIEQLEQVATETGVPFREVVLMTTRGEAVRGFEARTLAATEPMHVEAWQMTEAEGGLDVIAVRYDRLLTLLERRPAAVIVDTVTDDAAETYERLLDVLGARKP